MRLRLLILVLLAATHARAAVLFSRDYNITGLGRVDQLAFSAVIPLGPLAAVSTVELELSHSYVGELVLTLEAPTGQEFTLLGSDGDRTRVGAGNGLLSGVELYTLRNPAEATLSVTDWDFSGYQPGGTYAAREWPAGAWEAGTWNLTLFNNDRSFAEDGVVGRVTMTGVPVPEPSAVGLLAGGFAAVALRRRRCRVGRGLAASARPTAETFEVVARMSGTGPS